MSEKADGKANSGNLANPASPLETVVPPPTKTPMYQAYNAARYQRQALIKEVKTRTNRELICYISGGAAGIDRDDTLYLVDLLHNVPPGSNLDLLLHTPGGDLDATEKLCVMIRDLVNKGTFRVIVPDFAKSAGTLVALGADYVVMSETSELGPIDPQVRRNDGNGNLIWYSVQSYLDAFDTLVAAVNKDPNDIASQMMLGKLDPTTVVHYQRVVNRARQFAETQMKFGMFRNEAGNYTEIPRILLDTKQWPTHGQMIGWQYAKKIGLNVEYMKSNDADWQMYWQLYCLQRLAVGDRQKLFESDYASLSVDGAS